MFAVPRFKASLHVRVAGDELFVVDEHRAQVFEGRRYARLAALLDGERSLAAIARELQGEMSLPEVYALLDRLNRQGLVVEGAARPASPAAAFLEYRQPGEQTPRPPEGPVRLRLAGLSEAQAAGVREGLVEAGLALADEAEAAALEVVLADDYANPALGAINDHALRAGRPWLLAKPLGTVLWLGPLFRPGKTGCWACLAQRLRANRQMERYVLERREDLSHLVTARAHLASTVNLASALVVTEALRTLSTPASALLEGRILTLDLRTRVRSEHTLVKRPQCPTCGTPRRSEEPPEPVRLQSRPKRFREDGGHRTATPQETFDRFKHHISPITGAVTELVPALLARSELTHTFVAGHNFSMGLDNVAFLKDSLRGVSGGKGSTEIQAKVSGLCEAIERYAGVYTGDEYSLRGTYEALASRAIHPAACMGFSEAQYAARATWNAAQPESRCLMVPAAVPAGLEMSWTPLWSLVHQNERLLPTAYCYYGHPDFKPLPRWCAPDSNGCAAGNTLEEAILQGFFELVERDAVAMWFYHRVRRRGVDLDSFGLPYLPAIRAHYAAIGRELWVLDVTNDLEVTTLACVSRRTSGPTEDILLGFGSHFDPRIAILRAITEVNQFLPSVSMINPDGSTRYMFGDDLAKQWWTTTRAASETYLLPSEEAAARLADFHDPSTDDLETDVLTCVDICRRKGLDLLVLDQTRPDLTLSVVRVVVPELCHFWRRFGKPRLFEVPRALGWISGPCTEDDLNPRTIFF